MGVICILWLREIKRYVRSRVQIVVSLGQPALYLAGTWFRLWSGVRESGPREAICSLWRRA